MRRLIGPRRHRQSSVNTPKRRRAGGVPAELSQTTERGDAEIAGTPYGPPVAALNEEDQRRIAATLREELRPSHPMTAILARGRKP